MSLKSKLDHGNSGFLIVLLILLFIFIVWVVVAVNSNNISKFWDNPPKTITGNVVVTASDCNSLIPLYRLYSATNTDHIYITSSSDRTTLISQGWQDEGITGYLFATQKTGTIPLYKFYSSQYKDHFYTTEESLKITPPSGYVYEGITGYLYPSSSTGVSAWYRLWKLSIGDHFYTSSATEKDNAVKSGYTYEGIQAYFFLSISACSNVAQPTIVPLPVPSVSCPNFCNYSSYCGDIFATVADKKETKLEFVLTSSYNDSTTSINATNITYSNRVVLGYNFSRILSDTSGKNLTNITLKTRMWNFSDKSDFSSNCVINITGFSLGEQTPQCTINDWVSSGWSSCNSSGSRSHDWNLNKICSGGTPKPAIVIDNTCTPPESIVLSSCNTLPGCHNVSSAPLNAHNVSGVCSQGASYSCYACDEEYTQWNNSTKACQMSISESTWSRIYLIDDPADLADGYMGSLGLYEAFKMIIAEEYHIVGLVSVNATRVIINVSSVTQQKMLAPGNEFGFDVNGDELDDLEVKLNNITGSSASFTLTSIDNSLPVFTENDSQTVTYTQTTNDNTNTPTTSTYTDTSDTESETTTSEAGSSGTNWLIIGLVVLIVAVLGAIVFVYYKKSKAKSGAGNFSVVSRPGMPPTPMSPGNMRPMGGMPSASFQPRPGMPMNNQPRAVPPANMPRGPTPISPNSPKPGIPPNKPA